MPAKLFDDGDINQFFQAMKNNLKKHRSQKVGEALEAWVEVVRQDSQSRVPYDTGRTHDSWFKEVTIKNTIVRVNFGYDKNNEIDYIPEIWSKPDGFFRNGKEPFWLRRAVEAHRDKLEKELSK